MNIDKLLTDAEKLEKTGDAKAALEKFKEIVKQDDKNVEAQFKIGELHHQLGELPAALSAYLRTTDLEPDHKKANVKIEMIKSILNFFNPDLYNP
ncbi:tetratricopeptide repeat protein [Marinifilum sp. RC60d5]|uniref:tetratricopeptide repeat protein n=1 Tax=Marinifilum sp. RC60d5 TaxID=3458414 RepID=UPI00403694D1